MKKEVCECYKLVDSWVENTKKQDGDFMTLRLAGYLDELVEFMMRHCPKKRIGKK